MALPFIPLIMGAVPHLKKYWKEIAVAGMVAMLLYQNFSPTRFLLWIETIPSLENRLEISEDNYKVTKEGNEELTRDIEDRNTQIDNWKRVSDKNAAEVAKLQGELDVLRAKSDAKVDNTLNDPTPVNDNDAIQYLRNGIGDVQW